MEILKELCISVKRKDTEEQVDLQKRGVRQEPPKNDRGEMQEPIHGQEFFFSNVMMKIYQIPMLFMTSSEFLEKEHEGTFIVMIFERTIKKRQPAYSK